MPGRSAKCGVRSAAGITYGCNTMENGNSHKLTAIIVLCDHGNRLNTVTQMNVNESKPGLECLIALI